MPRPSDLGGNANGGEIMTAKEASKAMYYGMIVTRGELLFRRTCDGNVVVTSRANPIKTIEVRDYRDWIVNYKGQTFFEAKS